MSDVMQSLSLVHTKLDGLKAQGDRTEAKLDDLEQAQASTVRAVALVRGVMDTLVLEVARLADAVDREPPGDNLGELLRRLTQAVEGNTRAVEALVALTAPRQIPAPPQGHP